MWKLSYSDQAAEAADAPVVQTLQSENDLRSLSIESLAELAAEHAAEIGDLQFQLGQRSIDNNLNRLPQVVEDSLDMVFPSSDRLNEFLRQEYEAALDANMPEWREVIVQGALDSAGSVAQATQRFASDAVPQLMQRLQADTTRMLATSESLLRGELPEDMRRQIEQRAAERAQARGVRGQAEVFDVASDLAQASMQAVTQGQQAASVALGLAPTVVGQMSQTLANQTASSGNLFNLGSGLRQPTISPAALYAQFQTSMLGGVGMDPTAVYTSTGNIQTNMFSNVTQYGTAVNTGIRNFNADMATAEAMMSYNERYLEAAKEQALWQAGGQTAGGIIGGLIGGPAGAQIGSSIGGTIGSLFGL